ncbi:unnamed protein product [Cuscuta campestris]|uniref:Tetraspanin n=1 Tax=Cuscuta campestris TaxID=132261 RepID=A0A484MVU9_9ASTE|nr:unnamed protein product [Cuscuta campestris]
MASEIARICIQQLLKAVNSLIGLTGLLVVAYAHWKYSTSLESIGSPDENLNLWFLYASLCVAIALCLVACLGHAGAETANAYCLNSYLVLMFLLLLVEVHIGTFVFLNNDWKECIPEDPTGAIDEISDFIASNNGLCQWAGLLLMIIQSLCATLALLLHAIVEPMSNGVYDPISGRAPLLPTYVRLPFH